MAGKEGDGAGGVDSTQVSSLQAFSNQEILTTRLTFRHSADAAFMRTLLRSSRRRKGSRAFWAEVEGGTLRRAASEECLPGEQVRLAHSF